MTDKDQFKSTTSLRRTDDDGYDFDDDYDYD